MIQFRINLFLRINLQIVVHRLLFISTHTIDIDDVDFLEMKFYSSITTASVQKERKNERKRNDERQMENGK